MKKLSKKTKVFISLFVSAVFLSTGFHWINKADVDANTFANYADSHNHSKVSLVSFNANKVQPEDVACESIRNKIASGIEVEMVGTTTDGRGITYRMWYYEHQAQFFTIVSAELGNQCGLAFSSGLETYITERVPLAVARDLTTQFYRKIVNAQGGVESYEQNVRASLAPPNSNHQHSSVHTNQPQSGLPITSVDEWAMNEIGIILPPGTFTVTDIDDEWQYK